MISGRSQTSSGRRKADKYIYKYPTKTEAESIIRAMLSGVDIIFIDPLLFDYLLPTVQKMKSRYEYLNEEELVKQLTFYENYMKNSGRKSSIVESPKATERSTKSNKRFYNDEDLENELEYILSTDHVKKYTPEQSLELVEGMKQKRQAYIAETNYLAADRAELFVKKLLQMSQLYSVREIREKKEDSASQQLKQAEKDLAEAKQKWEKVYRALRESAAKEFKDMEAKHDSDIKELEALREQPVPPSIAKYSNTLLDMRKRQEYLVKIRDFDRAAVMKDRADILQATENRDIMRRWMQNIDLRIESCNTAYKKNIASRRLYWKREETQLIQDAEEEVAKAERAIQIMKDNLNHVKVQKKRVTSELSHTKHHFIKTPDINDRQTPYQHLQKQVLNKKLYTATPRR